MFWPMIRLQSGWEVGQVRRHISSLCIDFTPCCVRQLVRRTQHQPAIKGPGGREGTEVPVFGNSRNARTRHCSLLCHFPTKPSETIRVTNTTPRAVM